MRIYFVRHGQSGGPSGLNEFGMQEISQVAEFLKTQNLDKDKLCLLASHRCRAVESAVIIQEFMGLAYFAEVDWLTECDGSDIPKYIDRFFDGNPTIQIIIAVSHAPEISDALLIYKYKGFNLEKFSKLENGSVNLVDLETKQIQEVFRPNTIRRVHLWKN